ncbi:MAG: HipA domain-containing protein [Bacteroidales bacterium]|nr:HipA domain-containing protein [Bacteroidales bacterium]
MSKCLYCNKEMNPGEQNFHNACARKFFGVSPAPTFDYTRADMDALAAEVIQSQTTLTGVQPKISLHLNEHKGCSRLTIVGLWGGFILKPQTDMSPYLPEVEQLTMCLAEQFGISVVPHSLIRMKDGELCYITRRIDRLPSNEKIAMEDLCQLSERPTEYKYKSSYEQVAKIIREYSSLPEMDLTRYYELLIFCWLTGNNDMHLKNFALYNPTGEGFRLTPAYDLLNAALVNPKDKEELALTLNGRKKKIKLDDFVQAMQKADISDRIITNIFQRFHKKYPEWEQTIRNSFLPQDYQDAYWQMVKDKLGCLQLL